MEKNKIVKGAKFTHFGENYEVSKVQEGVVYTTNGKQFSVKGLESYQITFSKQKASSGKPRGVRGQKREEMQGSLEELKYELQGYKKDLKQLNFDMELEAGEKGDKWTGADANRYGGEMNTLEEKIESLEKQIAQKEEKLSYAKGGNLQNDENAQMVANNNKQIRHHTEELESAVKGKHVPAWVVAKVNRAANDLSDATHYLDGESKYKGGGSLEANNPEECVCIKTIKFKSGLNFFENYTYHCQESLITFRVSYEDGRGVTMSKETFNEHFEKSGQRKPKYATGGGVGDDLYLSYNKYSHQDTLGGEISATPLRLDDAKYFAKKYKNSRIEDSFVKEFDQLLGKEHKLYYVIVKNKNKYATGGGVGKEVKVTGFKVHNGNLFATSTKKISFEVVINGVKASGYLAPKFTYTHQGVDINELLVNGKGVEISSGGGTNRSYELDLGSFKEKEKQPKNLQFTGPYYELSDLGSKFKTKLINIINNKPELLTEDFKKVFNITTNTEKQYSDGGELMMAGGNITSIVKRVAEVNELIAKGNELGLKVIDESVTWQAPMKYKPLKYSNGVLYIEYEELDLYKHNKGQGSVWKTVKDKVLKNERGMSLYADAQGSAQRESISDIARMYRKGLKHYDKYGYYEKGGELSGDQSGYSIGGL
jgi:hypothetical protein